MEDWLWDLVPWGYRVLIDVENWRTALLDPFFSTITQLGNEQFYIVLFTLIYWCFDKGVGVGVALASLLSTAVNAGIKDLFSIPRPDNALLQEQYGVTGRLDPLMHETSPSWPSNHTQSAFVTWGYLAWQVKKGWFWLLALLIAVLISFSRIYGGVHFPQDVIGGVLIALIYLALWLSLQPGARSALASLSFGVLVGLTIVIPLLLLLLHPTEDAASPIGAVIGISLGYLLDRQHLRFSPAGPWWQRVLRALLGLVLVFTIHIGLSTLFGLFDETVAEFIAVLLRAFRYALVGLIGLYAVPWLFIRIKLADQTS